MSNLTIYENARYWIAQYESVDEVKEYIDKAAAVQEYAKRSKDFELEHKAAKARILAERRAGELLREMDKAKGGNPNLTPHMEEEPKDSPGNPNPTSSTAEEVVPTIPSMGITHKQSANWQQLASLPEEEFNTALEAVDGRTKSAISTGVILNRRKRQAREAAKAEEIKIIQTARVIEGDCLSVLDGIEPIDLLIADPPYFTDGDFTGHVSQCLRRVKRTGQAYVFTSGDPVEVAAYLALDSSHMQLAQILVWNYNNTGQRQPNERYTSNYQLALYYRGPDAPPINQPADGKEQYACQTINAPDGRIGDRYHKWQKPLDLVDRFIRNSSIEGDFVFDPFVGSGSTVIAAASLGRKALGCDLDHEAILICEQRGCSNET